MKKKTTVPVSETVFREVYDSPASLPGRYKWLTPDEDVRKIEGLLGMPSKTIGAPLWVSGDQKQCPKCKREVNWLDIVASGLDQVHNPGVDRSRDPRPAEVRQRRGAPRHCRCAVLSMQDQDRKIA